MTDSGIKSANGKYIISCYSTDGKFLGYYSGRGKRNEYTSNNNIRVAKTYRNAGDAINVAEEIMHYTNGCILACTIKNPAYKSDIK